MSNSLLDLKALEANRNIVARNYWRDRLKGMEPASYFAHGQPPKASPASRHYGVCRVVASDEVYQTLCAVAPTDKARHMVLLAGLVILAAKYASAEKVCVFTPGYPGQEETLLIPFLAEDMNRFSFRDFLHTLKERLSADLKYGAYPLEKILATGGWTPAGVPVTGMLVEEFQASGVFDRLSPDILFSFGVSDRLSLRIRYDRNKYEDAPVTQLLHLYLSLLHRLIIGKATRIGEIGLASRDDEERILHQLNDTERNFPLDDPLTEIFRRRAESSGELPAVESADGHLNFRQLEEASNRLANYLAGDGLGAGEIIALRMERSIDLVVSILAVLKAGCLYLPIDPHYPEHRIRYMLEDSLAQRVLTKESLDEARDRIASCSPLLTEKKSHRWLYVFYTSGSTGRPKGVIGSQKGFINRLRWGWENYPYSDGEAACMKTSIGFVDHFAEIFSPLLQGIPLVIFGEEEILDPARMIAWLSEKRISRITLVPSLLRTLIALIREKNLRIGCLRYVFCSGEALPYSLGKEFYETFGEAVLINVYGSTEVSADATWFETDRAFFAGQDRGYLKRVPIGRPMSNVQVAIVDRTGMLLPPGVAGEILVGGDCVSPGYLNGPELTAAKMIDVPFFKQPGAYLSGDMGRWLANGDIEYLGRIDYQVKIRGIRIRLDEVEQVLVRCPGIGQAAVAVHGKEEDSFLVAYYVSREDIPGSALTEHLSGELPRAMIPSYFMRLPALPVTPGGKLDRQALPAPGLKDRQHYQAPSNEWEEKLVAIWATILRLDKETISVTDSFFELGGHSLRAMTLVNKIQGELGVEITIGDVFDARNIVNLGQLLQTSAKSDYMGLKKAERREYYPLSTAQRRLYYLYELDRTTLTYNLPAVIRLEGPLDKEKLRRVMLELVRRHGSLQTSFEIVRDEPVQKISDIEDFGIEYFRSAPDAIDGVIRQFIRPFGLHRAPLFRAGLIETAPEVHYLMADMHHIVSDGTSIGLLINDFMALYNGATPPPLAFEYKDYAVWQQSAAYQRRIARQKEFWVNEFSEAISPLDIPVDFVRPATTEGDFLWFDLTPEETRRLRALADAEVATISMVILAVLKVLFSRMARQDDIVVGMAVAGREQYELEGLIGMFPVVLPLRTYPKTHMRFREFLSALKSAFLGVFDNQSYQYEELGRELKLERTSSRNPWFDVLYLYQNFETSELSLPDLKVSEYREQHIVAYEKLNLTVKENDEQIFCKLIYSKALFREETMERLVKYFRQVVAAVIRDPDVVLSGIQLMNADERQALLNQSGKISPLPRDKTFADLFEQQVKRTPKNPAVEHNGLILTYEELYAHSVKLASHLVRAGAGPGRNVCVFLPRGIELLVSMLAIFRTGAVYVPADVDFPSQRVKEIVADSASGIVITSLETVRMMNELKQVVPTIKEVICLDRLEDIRQANNLQMPRNADDLAYIIYTSGTTGKPKGVMIHQLGLINHLYGMIDILQIDGRDGIAQTASPCFDISVWQFLTALLTGGRTIIVDKDRVGDPSQMTDILQRCRITIFQTVPSVMAAFLEELPSGTDRSLPELRWMIPTGETLSASLVKKWYAIYPGIRLLNAYGPAEASDDIATFIVPPMEEGDHVVPVGKPVQNMRIYILDESLNLCAIGIKGEICTAGPGVGKGYWKDAEKTRKAFVPNPYLREGDGADYAVLYRSGDIGYYQPDGGIVFTGRQDEQVKIRGHRIELGEIESRLLGHENIREAKVLVKEGPGGQALVAYYVSGEMIVAGELEAYLAARLPHYMIPSYFIHLRAFPLTVNGKVDKRALPDIGIRTEDEYIAPRNSIDKKLAGIWAGLLQIPAETISMNANFFYVGGHSLNAITLLNRVCKEFHIHMPLKEFLQKATIRWQSDTIHSQLGQAYSEPMSGTTEILI